MVSVKTKGLFLHINMRMNSGGNSFSYLQVFVNNKKERKSYFSSRFILERRDRMVVSVRKEHLI